MSKTDKTRPWRVKMQEHPREVHNHANGICEIAEGTADVGWGREVCYLDAQWWRPEFKCGCYLCGWPSKRKQDRQDARRQIRQAISG